MSPAGQLQTASLLFGLFSFFILCLKNPLYIAFPQSGWPILLLLSIGLGATSWYFTATARSNEEHSGKFFSLILMLYFFLIGISGGIHALALYMTPEGSPISITWKMNHWILGGEISLTILYLLFPLMAISQYYFFRLLGGRIALRWLALVGCISVIVAMIQLYVDPAFLYSYPYERCVGLATDASALGLSLFLLGGIVVVGMLIEQGVLLRLLYVVLLLLIIRAVFGTWSRTSTVGLLAFLALLPALYALSARNWSVRRRFILGAIPLLAMLLLAASVFSPGSALNSPSIEHVVQRLGQTWGNLQQGGGSEGLMGKETRGKYFVTAYQLAEQSPLAGWGPGGFYRESNSMRFRKSGMADLFDSPTNHYLMIAVDFGLPVMLLNVLILLTPIVIGFRALGGIRDETGRFMMMVLLCSNIMFLLIINVVPPSYFLGVMWLWTALFALMMTTAEQAGASLQFPHLPVSRTVRRLMALALILVVASGGYVMAFGDDYGYASRAEHAWWLAHTVE